MADVPPSMGETSVFFSIPRNRGARQKENPERLHAQDLVGAGGFEPPKHYAADLQSVPIGHSGKLPYSVLRPARRCRHLRVLDYYSKRFPEMQALFENFFDFFRNRCRVPKTRSGQGDFSGCFAAGRLPCRKRCDTMLLSPGGARRGTSHIARQSLVWQPATQVRSII